MQRPQTTRMARLGVLATVLTTLSGILATGCGAPQAESHPSGETAIQDTDEASLRAAVDEALNWTCENRHLNLQEHAAWQILHGVLTYKRAFMVAKEPGGELVSAVDHVLAGGAMNGWTMRPGVVLDAATDRRGLIAEMEPGSKTGQGHADQWLAILAQCDLPPTQTIVVGDRVFTMEDFVRQVQWDVPRNVNQEYSWTLIGLTTYLPTTATWTAQDDKTWSIERLVDLETRQELATSACGGTHRLIGLSMALNRHLAEGHPIEAVWAEANKRIQDGIDAARRYQNEDGSFSSNY
ncbi:MAG: ADP-ribosylation factor-directed GTPase activating protein isoform b, partial [Planctomycetes bacterium]|nr:ADP-ribosylation factor-directed GTPase activating protein isoform b [Planctomycetota bacterium]